MWPKEIKLHEDDYERKPLEAENDVDIHNPILGQSSTIRIRAGSSPEKPKNNLCCPNNKADDTERSVQRNIRTCLAKQLNCCGEVTADECGTCKVNEGNVCSSGPPMEKNPCETGLLKRNHYGSGVTEKNPNEGGITERNLGESGPLERKLCGNGPPDRKQCGSNLPERNPFGGEVTERMPYRSGPTESNLCGTDSSESGPCGSGHRERNSCMSRSPEKNSCGNGSLESKPCTSGSSKKVIYTSRTKQRRTAVDPVDQIIEEGLQQQSNNRRLRRVERNPNETQQNHNHRRSKTAVQKSFITRGYQPDYYNDAADMQNWENWNNQRQRNEDREQRQRSQTLPDLGFVPYEDQPMVDGDSPASRRQDRVSVSSEPRQIQQELLIVERQRLKLLKRVKRIHCALLAEVEAYEQRPEELQSQRQHRIENEKQKVSEMRRRLLEQQNTEPQLDDQVMSPSSYYCGQKASTQRNPLTTPIRPAEADQQQRRKLYYKPTDSTCTVTSEENSNEQLPVVRRAQAPAFSRPKRRVPYQPPLQSDSSSSACDECVRRISVSNRMMNATTPERRKRAASTGSANTVRSNRHQNHNDNYGTRPRTLDATTPAVPSVNALDTSGYYYNTNQNGTQQSLNFQCNCSYNHCSKTK